MPEQAELLIPPDFWRGKRVLIVENDEPVRALPVRMLRQEGAEVLEAENGQVALKLVEEANQKGEPIDLVFTDLNMPGGNGRELINGIRGNKDLKQPVIVLASSEALEPDEMQGIDGFIPKPYSFPSVLPSLTGIVYHRLMSRKQPQA